MPNPSPVTPSEVQATIPETTGSICTKLSALWSLANVMFEWFDWFLDDDGNLSDEGKDFLSPASVPTGSIVFWPLDIAPTGWLVANGSTVSRTTYASLYAVYGTKYGSGDGSTTFGLPNMQRKFPFGSSGSNVSGSTGGSESATLVAGNLPEQSITYVDGVTKVLAKVDSGGTATPTATGSWSDLSSDELFEPLGNETPTPVDILPPYFSGHFIIKV